MRERGLFARLRKREREREVRRDREGVGLMRARRGNDVSSI
jgi:hypothetical protein